ncbi:hypothetical protein K1T71_009958 [Dendrolimus kikuchii]|uniref:Uncharacterized protein n=1 Tax=Dendrolimus kikuchii TaxID=765133 RepID=A0ACC1CTI7_9NEOP|nr:hypothetical protein K1T71_009958 [Dendrolimus kikuchii]
MCAGTHSRSETSTDKWQNESIKTRVKEHIADMKHTRSTKSAISEHTLDKPNHYIRFDNPQILAKENRFIPRMMRELCLLASLAGTWRDLDWRRLRRRRLCLSVGACQPTVLTVGGLIRASRFVITVAKPGLTRNKVMLCVWWDWKGIIHYELLPLGRTIDSELYCEQLMRLKQKVQRKRPELINRRGVVFLHDNAKPHISLATQQKLREFGWKVLMHPPYSPDLAPSDFHLFRSLQNSLGSVRLTSREDCQNHLSQFFDQKP